MFILRNNYALFFLFSFLVFKSHAGNVDYLQIEKNLKRYEQKIESLKQSIDNSVFNDEEILLSLDFDNDKLIAFMQDKFAFQPYVGLLRGVQGTLNARSGNALDQAILLAKLLSDAGMEARIANGELSDELSKILLSGISNSNIPEQIGQGQGFEKALAAFSHKANKKPEVINWQETSTYTRYQSSLSMVNQVLKENNATLKKVNVTKQLINQSKEYFWVQYRLGPSNEWSNAHPAFKKDTKVDVKAMSFFKDSVPEKYLHQVKIEAFIQQRLKDKYITHSLMKSWQKPVANLQNQLITYSNSPSGVSLKSDFSISEILTNTQYFTPTFNGNAVGGSVFDLKGRLIDSEAMNSQAGGLFLTLGDKTLMAMDKIDGKEEGESSMQLMAQWLQFTFTAPNGEEFVQKRYLYQAAKEKNVDATEVKYKLLTEYSLLVNSGEKPMAYLADVYLQLIENGMPFLKSSVKKLFSGSGKAKFPKTIEKNEFELLTQYYWMNHNPNLDADVIRYHNSANMLGFKRGYVDAQTAFVAVDVIRNKQQFINKKQDSYLTSPLTALSQGVWDTAVESLPAKILAVDGNSINTLKVTSTATKQKIELQLIKTNGEEINQIFKADKVALQRIQSDLSLGYWVIVPKQKPVGLSMSGWWRIDPKTGETLGMTADGGGQEATEYMIQTAQNALMLVRALGNLKKCEAKTNDFEKLCCLAEAHFNNVGGMAFGSALGGAVGTSAAAVFDIVDFGTELITGTGIAPSTNGQLCAGIKFPEF